MNTVFKSIVSSNTWVDGACLDTIAQVLLAIFGGSAAQHCAVLSSQVSTSAHNDFWPEVQQKRLWEKDIWLVPLYRGGRWILCVAYLQNRTCLLFDSLCKMECWVDDVQVRLTPRD